MMSTYIHTFFVEGNRKKSSRTSETHRVVHGISLVFCIINLLLWVSLLLYGAFEVSNLYREVNSLTAATKEKPSAAILTQTKQEVEEKLIVRLAEEIRNIRRENGKERKNLKRETRQLRKKFHLLETQYDNFKRFWTKMVKKVISIKYIVKYR